MLKTLREDLDSKGVSREDIEIPVSKAAFPAPFNPGLEFAPPVRGTWNIVHTGMLVPEAHEIFACGAGCLRGVILTAAEMNTADRFSTIEVRDNNLYDGDLEYLAIDGVADVLNHLPYRPRAVLLYTNCLHHFAGCDFEMIYRELRNQHPDIDFIDCYMNPIMRKSGRTPDQLMRTALYGLLHERPLNPKAVAIIGNDLATRHDSELYTLLTENGFKVREIHDCKSYDEYQEMAESSYYISYYPSAAAGGDDLYERLRGKHIYLPFSFDFDEIEASLHKLSDELGVERKDYTNEKQAALDIIKSTKELVGDTEITIDYTYCVRPLGLARLLLENGFNVTKVYADGFIGDDKKDYDILQAHFPELKICPTAHSKMRYYQSPLESNILAIGQKAAYYDNTKHFVNAIQGDGMFGYEAVVQTMKHICFAFENEQDMQYQVSLKGLGCEHCI